MVEGCPHRGCYGWSSKDTPVLQVRKYMVSSQWTAEAARTTT